MKYPILEGMQKDLRVELALLQEDHVQKIQGSFDPSCLEVREPDLSFLDPIEVNGEVSLSDGHVVVHLNASTKAHMPCAICNEMTPCVVRTVDFRYAEPLEAIAGPHLDVNLLLREALLLELPKILECNQGKCPERAAIAAYLASSDKKEPPSHNFPFAKSL
jgi:uncharacterized metal-binding protein YceD (DUF177 family)